MLINSNKRESPRSDGDNLNPRGVGELNFNEIEPPEFVISINNLMQNHQIMSI